jgi:hypothetical protein
MHRILLIDDDELLAPPLAAYLRRFDLDLHSRALRRRHPRCDAAADGRLRAVPQHPQVQ